MGYFSDLNTAREFDTNFSTLAKESELCAYDAVEKVMAHIKGNEVRRVYDLEGIGMSLSGRLIGGRMSWER